MQRRTTTFLAPLLALGALALSAPAQAGSIDFTGLAHGQVIDDEFELSDGLTISAINHRRSFHYAVIFDSGLSGTRDGDLEGPTGRQWAGGNADPDEPFGNLLIVQENETGCDSGVCDLPDDEGGNGGDLVFAFDHAIESFGFDAVDLESDQAANANVLFFSGAGPAIATVSFAEFECAVGPFCDSSVAFIGNNGANHLADVTAAALGVESFDRVVIDLAGSGAVDNIRWTDHQVPEPGPTGLLVGGAMALAGLARRHRVVRTVVG